MSQSKSTGGGGGTSISGTPADNQVAVWTDASTIEGTSSLVFDSTGLGIGVTDPDEQLEVAGRIHISSEVAAPSAPAAGNGGILYTKADGKPYWISDDVAETDLTSGGGGSSLWSVETDPSYGDDIYRTAGSGRVGIGISDLSGLYSFDMLNIYGASGCSVNIDSGSSGGASGINFKNQGSTEWKIYNEGTGASSKFYITSDDSDEVVAIKQDGKVRIGTHQSLPTRDLEVRTDVNNETAAQVTNEYEGTSASAQVRVASDTALGLISCQSGSYSSTGVYQADALSVFAASTASGGLILGTEGDHNVSFYQNNSPAMTLDGTGLGIGTSAPSGSLTVDDITIDGSTISDAGEFTLDVGGDILLDAAGADIRFISDGVDYCKFTKDGNNAAIKAQVSDGDIILRGSDGGSQIDALTLDMSEAGNATFNADVYVPSGSVGIGTSAPGYPLVVAGGSNSRPISIQTTTHNLSEFITSNGGGKCMTVYRNSADGNHGWGVGRHEDGEFMIGYHATTGSPDTKRFEIGTSGDIKMHGDTMDVESTITSESQSLSITENGMDKYVRVNITGTATAYSLMTIPRPSACPIGRRITFDVRETGSAYFWIKTGTNTDYFISNYDRYQGTDSGGVSNAWNVSCYGYPSTDQYGVQLLTITNNGTEWVLNDGEYYSGNSGWYTSSYTPY